MNLFSFALHNLLRRPARTLLSVLGIGLSVGCAMALLALGTGISESVGDSLTERGDELAVTQRGATDVFSGHLPEALGDRLAALPDIDRVTAEVVAFAATADGRHLLVAGWPPAKLTAERMPLASGRLPRADETRVLLVGDATAETLKLQLGDRLTIFDEPFEVIGITRFASVMNRGLVILPLAAMQEVSFRPGQVSGFYMRLRAGLTGEQAKAVRQRITAVGPVLVSDVRDFMANDRNVAVLNAVSFAISVIALGMGGLNVLNTLLMSVQERTREIGIIIAVGWPPRRIIALIMVEGLLLGVLGCLLGVAIGIASSRLFGAIPAIGNYITFQPRADNLALPLATAIALCVLGAVYPAWRAVRMSPAAALRAR